MVIQIYIKLLRFNIEIEAKSNSETKNLCLKLRNIRGPSYSCPLDLKAQVETYFLPFFECESTKDLIENMCQ